MTLMKISHQTRSRRKSNDITRGTTRNIRASIHRIRLPPIQLLRGIRITIPRARVIITTITRLANQQLKRRTNLRPRFTDRLLTSQTMNSRTIHNRINIIRRPIRLGLAKVLMINLSRIRSRHLNMTSSLLVRQARRFRILGIVHQTKPRHRTRLNTQPTPNRLQLATNLRTRANTHLRLNIYTLWITTTINNRILASSL